MYIEYCLWAQVAVLNYKLLYWTVWDRFIQVLYLGRAPRIKETLSDFREKYRVTRHSRVFRRLTGSQRTPRVWGVTERHALRKTLRDEGYPDLALHHLQNFGVKIQLKIAKTVKLDMHAKAQKHHSPNYQLI